MRIEDGDHLDVPGIETQLICDDLGGDRPMALTLWRCGDVEYDPAGG